MGPLCVSKYGTLSHIHFTHTTTLVSVGQRDGHCEHWSLPSQLTKGGGLSVSSVRQVVTTTNQITLPFPQTDPQGGI